MVPKAAKVEEAGADSSLSNGSTGTANPLAFGELTDILRCGAAGAEGRCLGPW